MYFSSLFCNNLYVIDFYTGHDVIHVVISVLPTNWNILHGIT